MAKLVSHSFLFSTGIRERERRGEKRKGRRGYYLLIDSSRCSLNLCFFLSTFTLSLSLSSDITLKFMELQIKLNLLLVIVLKYYQL